MDRSNLEWSTVRNVFSVKLIEDPITSKPAAMELTPLLVLTGQDKIVTALEVANLD